MINREKNPTQKLLPCGARKSQIVQMYPREPEGYLRKLIHSIQVETNPHLSIEAAKNRKRLSRREIEKLIDVVGLPKGIVINIQKNNATATWAVIFVIGNTILYK